MSNPIYRVDYSNPCAIRASESTPIICNAVSPEDAIWIVKRLNKASRLEDFLIEEGYCNIDIDSEYDKFNSCFHR